MTMTSEYRQYLRAERSKIQIKKAKSNLRIEQEICRQIGVPQPVISDSKRFGHRRLDSASQKA